MATDLITQSRLKSLLTYDADTGEFCWAVSTSNRTPVGSVANCRDKNGYVVIRVDKKLYKAHRLAWLYEYGVWPTKNIDHINLNSSTITNNIKSILKLFRVLIKMGKWGG